MEMRRSTRVFVRRQANWFKTGDPSIHWFTVAENTLTEMVKLVQEFITGNG